MQTTSKKAQLKQNMIHPFRSLKDAAYYHVYKGEINTIQKNHSVIGVVLDLSLIIYTLMLTDISINIFNLVIFFIIAYILAAIVVYGVLLIAILFNLVFAVKKFSSDAKIKRFDLGQIKYGIRHPVKSYIDAVKGSAYYRFSSDSNVSSIPIGHMILVAPFFLAYAYNSTAGKIPTTIFETILLSAIFWVSIGIVGMSIYQAKTSYTVKRRIRIPSLILLVVFTAIGFSGFLLDWEFGLFILTSLCVFPFYLLHMWHYRILITKNKLIIKRFWGRSMYMHINSITNIVLVKEPKIYYGKFGSTSVIYQRLNFTDANDNLLGFYRYQNMDNTAIFKDIKDQLIARGNYTVQFTNKFEDYLGYDQKEYEELVKRIAHRKKEPSVSMHSNKTPSKKELLSKIYK